MEPKSKKRQLEQTETTAFTRTYDSWPRFLVVEPVQEGALNKLSPFAIEKGIQGLSGPPKSIKKLRSGGFLVEASTKAHSENLLRSDMLVNVPIKVSKHRSLNYKKGVIWCEGLDRATETEIEELKERQNITEVKRISVTRDGVKKQTHTYILTFQTTTLPTKLRIGYIETTVKPYIPNPLRCFKCQRFGHHRSNCRSNEVCARCLGTDHDKDNCSVEPKCRNCDGGHESSSRDCPVWKREWRIAELKVQNNITYNEAKKLVSATTPANPSVKVFSGNQSGKSFSAAVASSFPFRAGSVTSVSTQTDITWPNNQRNFSTYKPVSQATQTTASTSNVSQNKSLDRSKSRGPRGQTKTTQSQNPRAPSGSPNLPRKNSGINHKPSPNRNFNKQQKVDQRTEMLSNKYQALDDLSPDEEMDLTASPPRSPQQSPQRGRSRHRRGNSVGS